mgnify:CR=1 FL=1
MAKSIGLRGDARRGETEDGRVEGGVKRGSDLRVHGKSRYGSGAGAAGYPGGQTGSVDLGTER